MMMKRRYCSTLQHFAEQDSVDPFDPYISIAQDPIYH